MNLYEKQKKRFENLNICFDISSLDFPKTPLSFKSLNKVNNVISFVINKESKINEFYEREEFYKKKINELTNIIETSNKKKKEQNDEFEENEEKYESENKKTKISIKTVKKKRNIKNLF